MVCFIGRYQVQCPIILKKIGIQSGGGGGGGAGVAVKENNLSLKSFCIIRISSSDKNLGWKRNK